MISRLHYTVGITAYVAEILTQGIARILCKSGCTSAILLYYCSIIYERQFLIRLETFQYEFTDPGRQFHLGFTSVAEVKLLWLIDAYFAFTNTFFKSSKGTKTNNVYSEISLERNICPKCMSYNGTKYSPRKQLFVIIIRIRLPQSYIL